MKVCSYVAPFLAFAGLSGCSYHSTKYELPSFFNNGLLGHPVPPMACVMPVFTDVNGDGLEDLLIPRHEGVKCLLNTGKLENDQEFIDLGIIPGTESYGDLPVAPMGEKIGESERVGFLIYTHDGVRYFRNLGSKKNN